MTTRPPGVDEAAARAHAVASTVTDPELPMLTLEDLGVLREVRVEGGPAAERVVVDLTPTYLGCPALAVMRDELVRRLAEAGYRDVRVQVVLQPPWSTDRITERGRAALARHGISPPGPAPSGPVPLRLVPVQYAARCPRCASEAVVLTSEFGPTACTALYRCETCREPFEHVKEH